MRVFLDTEFTRFCDGGLISLGLVAQSGEEFYAELPGAGCSDFVRETVLPLLGREPHALCADGYELGMRLHAWLGMVKTREPLQVCFDFQQDWDRFAGVLGTVPAFCVPRLLDGAEVLDLRHHGYTRSMTRGRCATLSVSAFLPPDRRNWCTRDDDHCREKQSEKAV